MNKLLLLFFLIMVILMVYIKDEITPFHHNTMQLVQPPPKPSSEKSLDFFFGLNSTHRRWPFCWGCCWLDRNFVDETEVVGERLVLRLVQFLFGVAVVGVADEFQTTQMKSLMVSKRQPFSPCRRQRFCHPTCFCRLTGPLQSVSHF